MELSARPLGSRETSAVANTLLKWSTNKQQQVYRLTNAL